MITKDTPVREDGFALDLRSFFWSILSGWRKILSCLLIGFRLVG